MLFACPHCRTNLDVAPEHFGQTLQCPACKGRLEIPAADTTTRDDRPLREGWPEQDHANVSFTTSLLIGLGIAVVFLAVLFPLRDMRLGDIFHRSWVTYAETILFTWGLTILFMKWRKNQRQERAALLNLFPESLGREINCDSAGGFIDNIYQVPLALRDSIIVNRIRKALELFESRLDNGEVAAFLNTQSDLDANRSSGSYILLKVFLWAIPILGFIGTVLGLSAAVGSLADNNPEDQEALQAAITNLTGGLGVAFDTTLLGLILSILLSFPMAVVQKKEEETLTIIDTFCTEKLLPKLNDSRNAVTDELLEKAESIPALVGSLARAHETFLVNLNSATRQLKETSDLLQSRLGAHQEVVEETFSAAVKKLTDTSSEIFLRSDQELHQTFENISAGISSMNKALHALGEEKIPTDARKKKGFFRR